MKFSRRQLFRSVGLCAASIVAPGPSNLSDIFFGVSNALAFAGKPSLSHVEASFYEKKADSLIECQLCPRKCMVGPRERGYCGVRENDGGKYVTLVHSRPCAVHIDPVEKKPFFHVLPGSKAFSIATAGCNVNCKFCQNWQISQSRPEQTRNYILSPGDVAERARNSGCKTVAYTYSEPVVFYEYMRDCARESSAKGMGNLVITGGYIQEKPLKELLKLVTAVKVDLKSFSQDYYKKFVRGELKPVLDGIITVAASGRWLEIVYLVVPTLNDSYREIRKMASWITREIGGDVPIHLSRFYPQYLLKNLPPTPVDTLRRLREECLDGGIKFVYTGNVPGDPGENTFCPSCDRVVISRIMFLVKENRVRGGKCPYCGEKIPGIFEVGNGSPA